ncbi:1077_t:CDS:1 [Dentiscutata heterogama]|uniref:1077_t:CDS:1 n=1 Tax=Dentiscutata heterogama TaxID=1316150 RepID=A0ACA9KBX6_9GLOM|nr:1077_t:CDS:1 [Dentiscutata heterogama]
MYGAKDIIVVIDNVKVLVKLANDFSLCKVRRILEANDVTRMTDSFYFTKNGALINISNENEYLLSDILDEKNMIYLERDSRPNWRALVRKFSLENGRNYDDDKDRVAEKKLFVLEDCEFSILEPDEYNFHTKTISSIDDLSKNENLIFKNTQLGIPNTVNFDFSIDPQNIRPYNSEEISSRFKFKNIVKAILSFKIKDIRLTYEFIIAVKRALNSQDLNILKHAIEKFGQFIPTVIIFGGRLHYKVTTCTGIYRQGRNESAIQLQDSLIFGGDKIKIILGEEDDWITSLQEFKLWDIIEFRNPVSIFEFLPNDLKDRIRELIGKTIIYSNIQDYDFKIHDYNDRSNIVDLKMPKNIGSIFSNKDVDPQVFATVSNIEDDDNIFTCMLYTPSHSSIPKVIINCTRYKSNQQKVHRVKIKWIVVGYDLSFNSIFNPEHIHLQSSTKRCHYNDNTLHEVLNIRTEYSMVLFGIPVVLEWNPSFKFSIIGHHFNRHDDKVCINLYGYDLNEKKYFTRFLSNFKFNLLYTKHPNPDIFSYFKVDKDLSLEKIFEADNNLFLNGTSNVHNTEFISLYKEGYNQSDPGFISRKNGHFFIKQPDGHISQDHFFVAVFNPEFKVQETENENQIIIEGEHEITSWDFPIFII